MRDIPTSPRIENMKRKNRKRFLRSLIFFVFLMIALIIGTSYFSNDKHILISDIKIEGTNIIDEGSVRELVQQQMFGKYFYLFNKANSFIYPKNNIYNNLLKNFSRIEELSIERIGFKTLSIKIKERAGSYLYCGSIIPEDSAQIGENCFFVNNEGYIFDNAPYFSGDIYFKFYTVLQNKDVSPLTQSLMNIDKWRQSIRFIDGVEGLVLKPVYISFGEDGVDYLYLEKRGNANNPKIIWNDEDNLETMLENLSLAMSKSEFANEIKDKYNTLSYIDLRFDNKVIYKFE